MRPGDDAAGRRCAGGAAVRAGHGERAAEAARYRRPVPDADLPPPLRRAELIVGRPPLAGVPGQVVGPLLLIAGRTLVLAAALVSVAHLLGRRRN
jgi:hypothetical protein